MNDDNEAPGGIIGAIIAAVEKHNEEPEFGPPTPMNDEAKALYTQYLTDMDPDCIKLAELKSEAMMVKARMEHRKEVFMHAFKRLHPETKDADGVKLDENNFTYQAAYAKGAAPRESPQWVKEMLAEDGKPHSIQ